MWEKFIEKRSKMYVGKTLYDIAVKCVWEKLYRI
jgi:hypothetical protein